MFRGLTKRRLISPSLALFDRCLFLLFPVAFVGRRTNLAILAKLVKEVCLMKKLIFEKEKKRKSRDGGG